MRGGFFFGFAEGLLKDGEVRRVCEKIFQGKKSEVGVELPGR